MSQSEQNWEKAKSPIIQLKQRGFIKCLHEKNYHGGQKYMKSHREITGKTKGE